MHARELLGSITELVAVGIVVYYTFLIIGYCLHRLVHSPKYGSFAYRIHREHHVKEYPVNNLLSEKYRGEEGQLTFKIPPLLFFCWLAYYLLPLRFAILGVAELGLLAWSCKYLHEAYHTKDSWLEHNRFTKSTFLRWRKQHFIHHKNTTKNLSIGCADLTIDTLAGTAKLPK